MPTVSVAVRFFLFHSAPHWSPDGRYLAINAVTSSLFPLWPALEECVVIETDTGTASTVGHEYGALGWCGPWLTGLE